MCVCDLPVVSCGRVAEARARVAVSGEAARVRALPRSVVAVWSGVCAGCGERFGVGEPIVRGGGGWLSGGVRVVTTSEVAERRAKALELHLAGATYEQIAAQLGYASKGSTFKAVQLALAARAAEAGDDGDAASLARLDALLTGVWPRARRGDLQAVDRVLKIEERRGQLLARAALRRQETQVADVPSELDELRRLAGVADLDERRASRGG